MSEPGSDDKDASASTSDLDLTYPLNTDSPFVAPFLERRERTAFFLVDVVGLSQEAIDGLIPTVLAEMEDRRLIPVFLAELSDFRAFRKHGVLFETLPDIATGAMALPGLDWNARRERCRALIMDKWKPQGTAHLGPPDPGKP